MTARIGVFVCGCKGQISEHVDTSRLAEEALGFFENEVLDSSADITDSDTYYHETHYAGLVDEDGRVNFYEGRVRAVDPNGTDVRTLPTGTPKEGVGVVEAARGTLYHHYVTDSRGMMKSVNLIVATVQNNAAMNLSMKKVAQALIHDGQVSEELLDRVEMAFRAYDPCLACASHALPGRMPLRVDIHQDGQVVHRLERNLP